LARRKARQRAQNGEDKPVPKNHKVRRDVIVEAKTPGQAEYLEAIANNDVVIADGPPGSGKSLLAIGSAIKLLREQPQVYKKIVMVRPAVVVKGEQLGFLPGDTDDKMAPFIAPLVDSLAFYLSQGEIQSLVGAGSVEVIPIAYMRGRTISNAVIIFDEAQNSQWSHMKMFLTRLGNNVKAIIEGDTHQSDLEDGTDNGLAVALEKFSDKPVQGIAIVELDDEDIVRSAIVKRIMEVL
jgi:phosphate starvation-inducible PhoH-like protein